MAQIKIPEARSGELCRRDGIRRLALFGSVLIGRFSESSDVDLQVELRLADIEKELSRLLGGREHALRSRGEDDAGDGADPLSGDPG